MIVDSKRYYFLKVLKYIAMRFSFVVRLRGRIYFGLNDLDRKIVNIMNKKNGYFIEIGANDGIKQSNTKHLELFLNWRGVLIEPIPSQYHLLKYSRAIKTFKINALCVPNKVSNKKTLIWDFGLMSTSEEFYEHDDFLEHISAARSKFGKIGKQVWIDSFTLNEILDQAKAPRVIDLLVLDTEGSELSVLKGLNLHYWEIQYIVIESRDFKKLVTI